jgi:hypothetical protein
MENREKPNNLFKLRLSLEGNFINERVFNADDYNQVTMHQVNLKSIINSIQRKLQTVLTYKYPTTKMNGYELLEHYKNNSDKSRLNIPQHRSIIINDKEYKGVEIKMGVYLNDNFIFERDIYVDRYNPNTLFSSELYYTISEIVDDIKQKIKKDDVKRMWEDYDIINKFNLKITQVRDLSKEERRTLLNRLYNAK